MKHTKKIILAIALLFSAAITQINAIEPSSELTITQNLGSNTQENTINASSTDLTDLLVDSEENSLYEVGNDQGLYELESVTIQRNRIPVTIEYYLGNFNTSEYIGKDEGFADYGDYFSDYILNINGINELLDTSVPSSYKLLRLDTLGSRVPTYEDALDGVTIKVLAGETKSVKVTAVRYFNKQNLTLPAYTGLTRTMINHGDSDFWNVGSLSTSIKAMVGQPIGIKSFGGYLDTETYQNRIGEMVEYGYFDTETEEFITEHEFKIPETATAIYLAGIYEVDDKDQPVVKPSASSSTRTGSSVGFIGNSVGWKSASVSETLLISEAGEYEKLANYPFNLKGDPFTTPEYSIYNPSIAWALNHDLEFTYTYKDITPAKVYYTLSFDSQGGSEVLAQANILAGTVGSEPGVPIKDKAEFVAWTTEANGGKVWDFAVDVINEDTVLYAQWKDIVVTLPEVEKPSPELPEVEKPEVEKPGVVKPSVEVPEVVTPKGKPTPGLPSTGIEASHFATLLTLSGIGILLLEILFKQRKQNQ